jgi:hypothetical protein
VRCLPLLCLLFTFKLSAQGLYQSFGQNTTQSRKIAYSLLQENVEIIYFEGGEELAKLTLDKVLRLVPEFENRLNYNLSNGIKITLFNHYEDFKSSNTNITNPQYYAGGYSSLTDNSASVYFDGSRIHFEKQVRKAVAEVLINEFIFGGNIRERIQTAALLTLPDWYYKGLVAYLSESWNVSNDNFLKDFFQNKKQKYFTSLQREDEILAGHSIWRYLEEKNGIGAVSNIVFLTKIGKSVENALIYYTGMNINLLLDDWQDFYLDKYKTDELVFKFPKGQENAPLSLARKQHTQFKLSKDGKKVAIVTNTMGKYQVVIYDFATQTTKTICEGGHQLLNRDIDLNYPLIAWHPNGKDISVVVFKNNLPQIQNYDINAKLINTTILKQVPFVKDFTYSPLGDQILFSVIRNGQTDLLLYTMAGGQVNYLTNDIYDNLSPRFSPDGRTAYFVSNKSAVGLYESDYFAIFKIDIADRSVRFVTGAQNEKVNITEPIPLQNGLLSFLSDKNGIVNNFVFDAVSGESYQLTNYKRCIIHNDVATEAPVVADLLYFNNRYRIYVGTIEGDYKSEAIINAANTAYRKLLDQESSSYIDSLFHLDSDSSVQQPIDSLIKSPAPLKVFLSGFENKDNIETNKTASKNKNAAFISLAKTHFGINYFLQQADVSILNNYLFPTNVSEKVFNYPLLSPHFQTSISDDLKNHVIVAGVRIPAFKIRASDYYLSYTNRKNRWDKELSMFRRSRVLEYGFVPVKMVNAQVKYAYRYPFNERARVEFSAFGRNDRVIRLAVDSTELVRAPINQFYLGNGIDYVFDNVRSNGLNLFEGIRFRVYSENYFRQGDGKWMSNNGFDFRWYQKLHRQIYLAIRVSGAASLGSQKTVYYMGGVENWLTNVDSNKVFNYGSPTYTGSDFSDYAFQTIIAPARGFYRNTRAGNKFGLINAEVRIPLFTYLIQKPISSEFFRSIMLIGFTDIGTAWKGNSPYSISNPFNTVIVSSQQYNITVKSQRDPFLYAFGFGIRAKILGHYIKMDRGWGIVENKFQRGITSFSLGLDF